MAELPDMKWDIFERMEMPIRCGGWEEELLLPGDDLEWEDANEEAQGDDSSHNNNGKEDIDKCTGKPFSEGVTILEWFPAFLCWLKDTMNTPVKVEMVNAFLSSSF